MTNEIKDAKTTAIIAYMTIIGTVIAIFMNQENKNEFTSFHIRQALGIFISFFLLGYFISYFDSWMVSGAFYLFYFILWIYGFTGTLQGELRVVPLVGEYFQNWFKNL
jgi:uncharacterized membrane protein